MSFRTFVVWGCLIGLLWPVSSQGQAPTAPPASPPAVAPEVEKTVRPDNIAGHKAAVQARLEALGQANLPKETLEAMRAGLEQLLKVLTDLEEVFQRQTAYVAQLQGLPQRLQELAEERKTLETRAPGRFPRASEQLRHDFEGQLQAVQAEIKELNTQTAAGEARLAAIAKELDQKIKERAQLEKDLFAGRGKAARVGEPKGAVSEAELFELQLQQRRVEIEALEAEREWLTKRGPLQDVRLNIAQARLEHIQQDLETIKQALSMAIEQEQATLSSAAAGLERKMEQVTEPAEALRLAVSLGTLEIRKVTAEYRQRLNLLGDEVLTQEKRSGREKQDLDRLASLVEKYASGGGVAQRLLLTFERLRRERARFRDAPLKDLEARVRTRTEQMFALDDRLYDFDRQAEARIAGLLATLQEVAPKQREADIAKARQALEEQKAALRDQQQVLAALLQELARLLTLHREYKQQLDDGYRFVLTKMFWLRDDETIRWETAGDVVTGAVTTAGRLQGLLRSERRLLWAHLSGEIHLLGLMLLVFLGLPWVVYRLRKGLRQLVSAALAASAQRQEPPGMGAALLIIVRSATWPAYLALVAWMAGQFVPSDTSQAGLALALFSGMQVGALILGGGLLVNAILQRDGWGQRFWGLRYALCRFLRRLIDVACGAALLLLVPYHILLKAPGEADVATGSLALARFMLLAFQGVVLVLVAVAGRRTSPLMGVALAQSRQREGLLWRIWPLLYLAMLMAIMGVMALDVLGYRYAAHYIWFRALESLSVILTLRLLLMVLVLRLLHRLFGYVFSMGGRLRQRYEEAVDRYFHIMQTVTNLLLGLLALTIILEIWGVSVIWLVTSPLGAQILSRALVIAIAIALAVVVIQLSNAFTDYLLQPKTTTQGTTRQVGRKLKTMAPLVQTLIKVGAMFATVLVILEQLGVATGPIIAGVGILGLAVGFASQSLIKDVINGLFILFEDSLSVGDVVMLRGVGGLVEKVTLRAVTIRDLSGNVHLIPNSSFDMITNMTKEYSRYVLDVGVAYRENVDEVISIMREIGEAMRNDPLYSNDMLEPIEIMGLDRFADSAVIIRARLKTRPIQQWRIGREFNRRLKQAFDERGIEIPFPHRTLYWGTPKGGTPPPVQVVLENQHPAHKQEAL